MRRMLFWATQGRTCARRPFCLVRAADGQQDRLAAAENRLARAAPGPHLSRPLGGRRLEQITQQAGRLRRGVAAHWWHLAPSARANTAHLPLSCSPLRGLSPRPYAYGAHALPAELRRQLELCLTQVVVAAKNGRMRRPAERPHVAGQPQGRPQAARLGQLTSDSSCRCRGNGRGNYSCASVCRATVLALVHGTRHRKGLAAQPPCPCLQLFSLFSRLPRDLRGSACGSHAEHRS